MTKVFGQPTAFVDDALAGFCDLNAEFVRPVTGGVVRSTASASGKVAVVVGGGSGHYPAFAGYVGSGIADGAVIGDVFTSPPTKRVVDVAREASHGGGVLLSFGNYAGDVLNFGAAAKQLTAEGIPTRVVAVTDDIASATADEEARRRGIAGDVVVFKLAGAAAEAGYDLDGVVRIAETGNRRTRSLGVAFAGVTLPGKQEPLFTVEPRTMGVGLGIHGEPGVSNEPLTDASGLAQMLVDKVLAAAPADASDRVAVLLNGLGSTKYEELFVLWKHVGALLRDRGLELIAPIAGEYVTSLDMAGCSLTVCWLDDELETLWTAPAQTPAMRCGAAVPTERREAGQAAVPAASADVLPTATDESRSSAARIVAALSRIAHTLSDSEAELGRIDSFAGDGDHGFGMARGSGAAFDAAENAFARGAGASTVLAVAGDAWAERAGGTSGALWGLGLRAAGGEFSDTGAVSTADVVRAARAALDAVVEAGGAKVGDKTLVDALDPLVRTLEEKAGGTHNGYELWAAAAEAATAAAEATAELSPRLGRARPLAERSVGHPDAGAVSLALCARTVGSEAEK
ncbi:homodimeric dihydroxyacetone kinase [Rhodococcus wratislaviensis]|uniref:Dihydroxyacetone kinase n=2 Tax=Rhodococcus wratislaviensis TaxID=44752 RepID=A0AB38FCH8_RHOWR|nr:dihydroxyacetone kinase family protein [Rhodococcus wratislaviensis]REE75685.1 homodimeric dihydroxyacetone kinase [Rhodococcus wratislaviensis]GAF50346.1 putative dihydroxyacetone kinase [Rhodococcus wratislaviensis NBRC 100605]SPZ39276.1 dihydroxyacetone kinase [Rhodococcus wratislaviensis]